MIDSTYIEQFLPQKPKWVDGGSRWSSLTSAQLDECSALVSVVAHHMRDCLGRELVLGVGCLDDAEWDCTIALTFTEGDASRELRIFVSADEALKHTHAWPYNLLKDEVYCDSVDGAWYVVAGLIRALSPLQLRFSRTLG